MFCFIKVCYLIVRNLIETIQNKQKLQCWSPTYSSDWENIMKINDTKSVSQDLFNTLIYTFASESIRVRYPGLFVFFKLCHQGSMFIGENGNVSCWLLLFLLCTLAHRVEPGCYTCSLLYTFVLCNFASYSFPPSKFCPCCRAQLKSHLFVSS